METPKLLEALTWITKVLDSHNVPYQISGGFAAHLYGATRPVNDIDIDIPDEYFPALMEEIAPYSELGLEQYKDDKWDLQIVTLNYKGQEIDLSGATNAKISNKERTEWIPFPFELATRRRMVYLGHTVWTMPPDQLIAYKKMLDGEHQQIDIDAVTTYLKKETTGEQEHLTIDSNGVRLAATILRPSEKKEKYPAVLFIHGWISEKAGSMEYAEPLRKLGYVCLLIDLRGHGESEGDKFTYTGNEFLSDAIAAYDTLAALPEVDTENISAVGSSFGSYLSAILSGERELKNLILRAPADYPDIMLETTRTNFGKQDTGMHEWRAAVKSEDETAAHRALAQFTGNVLFVESEKDDQIPHQTIANYMNALPDQSKVQLVVLKGSPHSLREQKFRDAFTYVLSTWQAFQ